ncbi:hypothetical protein D3C73_1641730 [compost metagenome]
MFNACSALVVMLFLSVFRSDVSIIDENQFETTAKFSIALRDSDSENELDFRQELTEGSLHQLIEILD